MDMLAVAAFFVTIGIGVGTLGRIFGSKYLYDKGMGFAGIGLILGVIAMALQ